MAYSQIISCSGLSPESIIFEKRSFDNPSAIAEGYIYFKDRCKELAPWLIQASIARDFEDNMLGVLTLRIGPEPFWSEEYLKEHSLGVYALQRSNS